MIIDIYQGDPKLFLDASGAYLNFKGGQPTLDMGLENLALISLFTRKKWCGNVLFRNNNQKYGGDFEEISEQPITLNMLNDLRNAAERDLNNPIFGTVTAVINNPSGHILKVLITLEPPGQDIRKLLITKNGLNWIFQAINPAHMRE